MINNFETLKNDWHIETEATLKILNALTDESLSTKVYSEGRTLSELTWHTVYSVAEMASHANLPVDVSFKDDNPHNAAKFAEIYKVLAENTLSTILENWTEEMLNEEIDIYGDKWKRGYLLEVLLRHQTHHRAQMTVLMRQSGIKVPGVYGPSKEEWTAYGREPEV